MSTQCIETTLGFGELGGREIVARFDGGEISSDAGALLLREAEKRTGIVEEFGRCFTDYRSPQLIEHPLRDLIAQRVYGLALGYEDLNDHDLLRRDHLLAAVVGKEDVEGLSRRRKQDRGAPMAGKSTLNRLELRTADAGPDERYKKIAISSEEVDRMLVDVFLDAHETPPTSIVIDFDATDDPVHGKQEGRFFHGFYREYCYLPLYAFCGEHLLLARLRQANIDASEGTEEELARIVSQVRARWPEVQICIRADSGFCRERIMAWCEGNGVRYVLGLAKNDRLIAMIGAQQVEAKRICEATGQAARVFVDLEYQTRKTWSRSRRVVAKAEHLPAGTNPRFVVTNVPADHIDARTLYEVEYCARGEMENRIKEQQLYVFADRTSAATMRANQIRLYFSSVAYVLLHALRRIGLAGTEMESAQCHTIRARLLRIGAQVRVTVRKIWISLSSAYPYQALFERVLQQLQGLAPVPG